MTDNKRRVWFAARVLLMGLPFFSHVQAASICPQGESAGRLVVGEGVQVAVTPSQKAQDAGRAEIRQAPNNQEICVGDTLSVSRSPVQPASLDESRSAAVLDLAGANAMIRLSEDSELTVYHTGVAASGGAEEDCKAANENPLMELTRGILRIFTTESQRLNIKTRYLNAAVEGTQFVVYSGDEASVVGVQAGVVRVCNESDTTLRLVSSEAATATSEKTPPTRITVIPPELVHWDLYYPQLGSQEMASAEALEAYKLLIAGKEDEARVLLARAADDPADMYARALTVVFSVVQNDLSGARAAFEALETASDSPSALMARSYYQQASVDLDAALESVEKAAALAGDDAYVLARLSELRLIKGDRTGAVAAARSAANAAGATIARGHSVLGFSHLAQLDLDAAEVAFKEAVKRDAKDPQAYLGLGLIAVRRDLLAAGIDYMETAVSLDPHNALYRSYLGKALLDSGDTHFASEHLQLATEFDDNDPTGHLYAGLAKLEENNPIGALKDIEKSIETSDNRAVYRSEQDLAEDKAYRHIAAARIYNELGMEDVAISEASKALTEDPSSFSAHRFMADAYLNKPRHEIARVSELLQSQIRQPLNNMPIQPMDIRAPESALADIGTRTVKFSEYSRIFSRNRTSGVLSAEHGDNNSNSIDLAINHNLNTQSFAVSYYSESGDGNAANRDYDESAVNGFYQKQFGDRGNVQLEVREQSWDNGDLAKTFDSEDYNRNIRNLGERKSVRLSSFITDQDNTQEWLINLRKEQRSEDSGGFEENVGAAFHILDDSDSYTADVQYVRKHIRLGSALTDVIIGGSYVDDSQKIDQQIAGFSIGAEQDTYRHKNGYLYIYPKSEKVSWVLGASHDDTAGLGAVESHTSYKLGLVADLTDTFSMRIAGFETHERQLVANQTLEPSTIAGFNQFTSVANGTLGDVLGIGFYARPLGLSGWRLSGEWRRDAYSTPLLVSEQPGVFTESLVDLSERSASLSAARDIGESAGLVFGFRGLDIDRGSYRAAGVERIVRLKENEWFVNLRKQFRHGWTAKLQGRYVDQTGEAAHHTDERSYSGRDTFTTLDIRADRQILIGESLRINLGVEIENLLDEKYDYHNSVLDGDKIDTGRRWMFSFSGSF